MTEQQGQAPEAADTTTTTAPPQADTGQQEQPQQQAKPDPKPTKPTASDDLSELSSADLAKMVRKLRAENASDRTTAKQQAAKDAVDELTGKLGKALGLVQDDKPPSVDDLTAQLTAAQQQATERDTALRQLTVERAAERAAREHGADVDVLLDSRSFATKLGDLDPAADDFAATVSDLVKQTVDSNPKYRVAQVAASSSADFSGGPGEQRVRKPIGLHAAFRNHYGG
ncbi:hypothetical protein Q7689_00340 [Nocardiopsis tropica]|uniref:hypothetical protein n=1 Tax=Nocardiopsis tropica TaxID=109330 RepID=UPI002E8C427C|nr:hypothetical protein [Nocardiopsis tropica]